MELRLSKDKDDCWSAEDQDHFLTQSSLHLSILVRNRWGEGKSERRVFMNKVQKSS